MSLRIAQIGTRHGHAAGKWTALRAHAEVEVAGIWEPEGRRRGNTAFEGARWYESEQDILDDASIVAVAIEGRNHESLGMADAAAHAGKHLWFDKPAGDDWAGFTALVATIEEKHLQLQMGYMFRYSAGFQEIAQLTRSGELGEVFSVRAHMSTNVDLAERTEQSRHRGGILYDLGGHMLDQIVWLLGRPLRVSTVLRNDATPELPSYSDNTVSVLEFARAMAVVDIAAMEPRPAARRLEVYGTRGSAVLEPFDPVRRLRLCLNDDREQVHEVAQVTRQALYDAELHAFIGVLKGERAPDRPLEHELLVQETLLRVTGALA